jgi:hypothetical protein
MTSRGGRHVGHADMHLHEDVAEWAVLPARSRTGGTCVQDVKDAYAV